jgi:hypothetical protein
MPSAHTRCLFADTPPSRVNAPMPPNRQIMYGNQPQMRPPPGQAQQQPGFRPHPGMRPPPMGFGMPQPQPPQGGAGGMPPPQQTRYQRSQVIFTSDDGNVQFLKFPPPTAGSGSGSGPGIQRPTIGSRHVENIVSTSTSTVRISAYYRSWVMVMSCHIRKGSAYTYTRSNFLVFSITYLISSI